MPDYRAYWLDDAGKFIKSSDFQADNDEEALEIVRLFREPLGFEVWTGSRIVGRIGRDDKVKPTPLIFGTRGPLQVGDA